MKFSCQESCKGKCCTYDWDYGNQFVFLTQGDATRIEKFLGRPLTDFANLGEFESTRFADFKTWQWYLKSNEYSCPFFENGRCGIYDARPTQCRTFPHWPEVTEEAIKDICPGVGHGDDRLRPALLRIQKEADEELRGHLCQPTK